MHHPAMYIFVNKGLGMSVGKIAAQASHAAVMGTIASSSNNQTIWENSPQRTIIVLEARNEVHLRNIREYLEQRDIATCLIIDEGINEIKPHVCTALATEILDKDHSRVQKTLSTFKLYQEKVKITLEFER